jgi:hypothetical protein
VAEKPGAVDHAAALAAAARIPDALTHTVITRIDSEQKPIDANFFLFLNDLGEQAVLTLGADRRFLAPHDCADFLGDLEQVVTRAAAEDLSAYKLAATWRRTA